MNQTNSSKQTDLLSAIKYFKADFPSTYHLWSSNNGAKLLQKHLEVLEQAFTDQKIKQQTSLRGKIVDELLLKLRFISKNTSYLQKFEAFLLSKFISFIIKQWSQIYQLNKIYQSNNQKIKLEVFERYSIIMQCLITILKYIFNPSKFQNHESSNNLKSNFTNQMIKSEQRQTIQIRQKTFTKLILQIIEQKLNQVLLHNIIDVKNIYPQYFSILTEGFLHYKSGNNILEIISNLILTLIQTNSQNIWLQTQVTNKSRLLNQLSNLDKQITSMLASDTLDEQDFKIIKPKTINLQNAFNQICKQRLFLFLQNLLIKLGYQLDIEAANNLNFVESDLIYSQIKKLTIKKFVTSLLLFVEKSRFSCANDLVKSSYGIEEIDVKILYCLILLTIELSTISQKVCQQSLLIGHLSKNSFSLPHSFLSWIRQNLNQLFYKKIKLVMNKNQIISVQKTILLKQIAKIAQFIDLQKMGLDQFERILLARLKKLFWPSSTQLNKPMIITIDERNFEGKRIGRQAIPLTELNSTHSFVTYPINLCALKQSLIFQQNKHILNQVRIFGWFQCQQNNLKYFRQFLRSIDTNSRVLILQYFIDELLQFKMQSTDSFYTLTMSLSRFYSVLINYFYIDCLLSEQMEVFNFSQYEQNKKLNLLNKLENLYEQIAKNNDIKRLQISSKQQQLLIYLTIKILYKIGKLLLSQQSKKPNNKMKLLYMKTVMMENLISSLSYPMYLIKLQVYYYLLEFAAPLTISDLLKPMQSTLIHRNLGYSIYSKTCNLEFMCNLVKICHLQQKQAEQLAKVYLLSQHITSYKANQIISLIFERLTAQTMRKCILSIKNWSLILCQKQKIRLLNNQPLIKQQKQQLFYANDGDNVTISNALGVIALQLNQKWIVQLQFQNPRKEIIIDTLLSLIQVNNQLTFWKRFFFEHLIGPILSIIEEIQKFTLSETQNKIKKVQYQSSRKIVLYQRIYIKIFKLLSLIPRDFYKYSTKISKEVAKNLILIKQKVEKENKRLKLKCLLSNQYENWSIKYKQTCQILDMISQGLIEQQSQDKQFQQQYSQPYQQLYNQNQTK